MRINPAIVRSILQELFVNVPAVNVNVESFALAPIRRPDDEVVKHWDRLREAGWITVANDIHSNGPYDFATYRPTDRAQEWADLAWDDDRWAEAAGRLSQALESDAT